MTRSDKDTRTVLLDRKVYIDKLTNPLTDSKEFSRHTNEKSRTQMVENQLTEVFKNKRDQVVNETIYDRIKLTGPTIPRLYVLPKIYKIGLPIRSTPDMSGYFYHSVPKQQTDLRDLGEVLFFSPSQKSPKTGMKTHFNTSPLRHI